MGTTLSGQDILCPLASILSNLGEVRCQSNPHSNVPSPDVMSRALTSSGCWPSMTAGIKASCYSFLTDMVSGTSHVAVPKHW